jgi:heme exporter protein A
MPAGSVILKAENITKKFDNKIIFRNISFTLSSGDSLAITGRNGSGKSTLIKILSGVLSATDGRVTMNVDGCEVEHRNFYKYVGVASPYLHFYEEFTARENLQIVCKIRSVSLKYADAVLRETGLYNRCNDPVKIYSSGMKQRLRLAFAILTSPRVLLLDEPTSNLDIEGIQITEKIISARKDSVTVIATNDIGEKNYCGMELNLDSECTLRDNGKC